MPATPSAAQHAALQQAMDPAPLVPDRTVAVGTDGTVAIDFPLPRFGVSLVTLVPAPCPCDTTGGDGGCGCGTGGRQPAPGPLALCGLGVLALLARIRKPKTKGR